MTESQYVPPPETRSFLQRAPAIAQRATSMLPFVRYVPKHPGFLIGAAVVGVLGTLAWRNRAKIAERAGPVLQNAADRARPMIQTASERLPWTRSTGTPAGIAEELN
jgi:hypothetical protein